MSGRFFLEHLLECRKRRLACSYRSNVAHTERALCGTESAVDRVHLDLACREEVAHRRQRRDTDVARSDRVCSRIRISQIPCPHLCTARPVKGQVCISIRAASRITVFYPVDAVKASLHQSGCQRTVSAVITRIVFDVVKYICIAIVNGECLSDVIAARVETSVS